MALLAVIDYGSGNLRSAEKALARAAHERDIDVDICVTSDADLAARADRIVLPGVGAFADCMRGLTAVPGMVDALHRAVIERQVPFLGICVGMQLLARVGREFGDHAGLGWIDGEVVRLEVSDPALKIPHMGWNEVRPGSPHRVFDGIADGSHFYFLHSFVFRPASEASTIATSEYGGPFTAAVARANIVGTQFHPEKSQTAGLRLLANFLGWRP
ncbi:MAG: imidazole glycerol phosphate synthase subunit HisH [Alphaproteobacteria bacterium]|nr:imidazole glycerol phosphate synthase subunit HisH [Alphaproteobacteria bacterium]